MNYAVQWSGRALESLAEIWLENPIDRDAIRTATAQLDRLLAVSPLDQGESRESGRRVFFLPPLAITFRVESERDLVLVLNVRYPRRPRKE